jgi:hypothetical protein
MRTFLVAGIPVVLPDQPAAAPRPLLPVALPLSFPETRPAHSPGA